jgi:hypothetical protein
MDVDSPTLVEMQAARQRAARSAGGSAAGTPDFGDINDISMGIFDQRYNISPQLMTPGSGNTAQTRGSGPGSPMHESVSPTPRREQRGSSENRGRQVRGRTGTGSPAQPATMPSAQIPAQGGSAPVVSNSSLSANDDLNKVPFIKRSVLSLQESHERAKRNNADSKTLKGWTHKIHKARKRDGAESKKGNYVRGKTHPEEKARAVAESALYHRDSLRAIADDLDISFNDVKRMSVDERAAHKERVRAAGVVQKGTVYKGKERWKGKGKGDAPAEPKQRASRSPSLPATFPAGGSWQLGGGTFQTDSSRGRKPGIFNRLPAKTGHSAGARESSPMVVSSRESSAPVSQRSSRQGSQKTDSAQAAERAKEDAAKQAKRAKQEAKDTAKREKENAKKQKKSSRNIKEEHNAR